MSACQRDFPGVLLHSPASDVVNPVESALQIADASSVNATTSRSWCGLSMAVQVSEANVLHEGKPADDDLSGTVGS